MRELILLLILIFVVLPIAVVAGIVFLIVKLVRRYRNKKSSADTELNEPVRKFSGSEIMFIIGTLFIILSGIAFGCAGWVNTSPTGKVFIMFLATAVMFGAGELFRRVVKLDGTATAFSIIGIVLIAVTVMTAGYYELFGEWLSADGDGQCMLFAISSVLIAVSSFIEGNFFGNKSFKYLSCMSVSATVIFLSGQISSDYGMFAVIMTLAQTIVTVWFVFGEIKSDIIKTSAKLSAVIFSVLAFVWVIDEIVVPDGATYFIMLLTLVQLVGYGIYLNNSTLKGLQSILSIMTAFAFVSDVQQNDNKAIILFSGMMLVIYSANRFVSCLKNRFSEALTLGFAVYSAIASATLDEPTAIIMPLIMSVLIMLYAFSEKKSVQILAGLCSPVLPFIIAENRDIYDIVIIILCIVTAAIICLPKYAFKLYAKFPRKNDTILYTNMIVSGITIIPLVSDNPKNLIIVLTACGLHIAVSCIMKNNWTGIFSVFGITDIIAEVTYQSDNRMYIIFSVFCAMMILSRIFFKNGIIVRRDGTTRLDIIMIVAWYAITAISSDSDITEEFLQMISTAIYIANFIRKKTNKDRASVLLSVSATITAIAFINRPFFIVESEMISSKITLAIVTAVGVAYRYIWRSNKKVSRNLSDMVFILSFAGLIYDVMDYHRLGNTIFGLAVTATILIISFCSKSRKWFGVSSVALTTITVWASVRYFGKLDWWVYLFIAGILFIAVAGVNEYLKSRNKKISDIFAGWK